MTGGGGCGVDGDFVGITVGYGGGRSSGIGSSFGSDGSSGSGGSSGICVDSVNDGDVDSCFSIGGNTPAVAPYNSPALRLITATTTVTAPAPQV